MEKKDVEVGIRVLMYGGYNIKDLEYSVKYQLKSTSDYINIREAEKLYNKTKNQIKEFYERHKYLKYEQIALVKVLPEAIEQGKIMGCKKLEILHFDDVCIENNTIIFRNKL